MSANILFNTDTDSVLDPLIELTELIHEFKHKLSYINKVFDHEIKFLESAPPDQLKKWLVYWEITEPENAREIRNSHLLARFMTGAFKLSLEFVFPEISQWYFRMLLQESLQGLAIKTNSLDAGDFADQRLLEIKERLKGALINWKSYHIRLLRQEYAAKLFLGSNG